MLKEQRIDDLPEELQEHFWEYDRGDVASERSGHTVILRLLQSGGLPAIRWLRERVGDEELRTFLVRRKGRGISPRRLRFWGLLLDLPRGHLDEWIEEARRDPWHQRTR